MKCSKTLSSIALTTFVGLCILVGDRFSKFMALAYCQDSYDFTSFLSCNLSFNRGVSLSLLSSENTYANILLFCVILCLTGFLVWFAYKRLKENKSIIAETLIIAGALGNLIDRLLYGAVVDFISVHYQAWYFPTFNVADIAVTLGVALFIVREWCERPHAQ